MEKDRSLEIINACRKLYDKYSYNEINLKLISTETSISRPSIYNYFETKDEIFLAILREEYLLWCDDLEKIICEHSVLGKDEFSSIVADRLSRRVLMLKIQCMNLYEIEENSRLERLKDFKLVYKRSLDLLDRALSRFFPPMSQEDRSAFIYRFYPFLYGLYPYAYPTEKQKKAMEGVGMSLVRFSISDMIRSFIEKEL